MHAVYLVMFTNAYTGALERTVVCCLGASPAVSFSQLSSLRKICVRLSFDEDAYPGGIDIGEAEGIWLRA